MVSIYTTLDTIIDTRLGLLSDIYGGIDFLKDIDYKNRTSNEFFGIPIRLFDELYKNRPSDIVARAPFPTLSIDFINEIVYGIKLTGASNNHDIPITLEVNLFPYKFTKEVIINLAKSIKLNLHSEVTLKFIDLPELTVDSVRKKYKYIFIHDGLNWMINNKVELEAEPIPNITLFAPLLTSNTIEYNEENMVEMMHALSILINLELVAAIIVSAQL